MRTTSHPPVLYLLNLPYIIREVLVIYIAAVDAFYITHHNDGKRQYHYFVKRFQHDLHSHHFAQLTHRHQAAKGQRKEDERVDAFAGQSRKDGTSRKVLAARSHLHAAHDIGIEKRPRQKGDKRPGNNTRCQSEHCMESCWIG